MDLSKGLKEKYLYNEVLGVFRSVVYTEHVQKIAEDVSVVFANVKNTNSEIGEDTIKEEVMSYLTNSLLWCMDSDKGLWVKTTLSDILTHIEDSSRFVDNEVLCVMIETINLINSKKKIDATA